MKRILPPIFMLMVVVVIAFATPIDAQKEQQVEPITTALHTEKELLRQTLQPSRRPSRLMTVC